MVLAGVAHIHLWLVQSKRGIAKAIRVLRDERNFPVLVHCIHGKDRTGLLVMLILLLCDIPPAVSFCCPTPGHG